MSSSTGNLREETHYWGGLFFGYLLLAAQKKVTSPGLPPGKSSQPPGRPRGSLLGRFCPVPDVEVVGHGENQALARAQQFTIGMAFAGEVLQSCVHFFNHTGTRRGWLLLF